MDACSDLEGACFPENTKLKQEAYFSFVGIFGVLLMQNYKGCLNGCSLIARQIQNLIVANRSLFYVVPNTCQYQVNNTLGDMKESNHKEKATKKLYMNQGSSPKTQNQRTR